MLVHPVVLFGGSGARLWPSSRQTNLVTDMDGVKDLKNVVGLLKAACIFGTEVY
jgi:hypothetical protein